MAVHLTMFDEEVKDDDIVVKMFRSLPSRFKQIMTAIKTLLDVLTMLVADLIGWLKEVQETFEEASMSLQQDRKLYLTEEEWDMRRKKHEGENHFGGDAGKCDSSLGGLSNKPTDDTPQHCGKMGNWTRECCLKPKEEQGHAA
jgi:hypothetical protein